MTKADKTFIGILLLLAAASLAAMSVVAAWLGRELSKTEWVNASVGEVLFLTLEAVLWYAWEARKQAKASGAAVEEMRRQRYADSMPLLIPKIAVRASRTIEPNEIPYDELQTWVRGTLRNSGKGLAINVRCSLFGVCLDSHPGKVISFVPQEWKELGVGEPPIEFDTKTSDLKLVDWSNTGPPRLVVEYNDIYERKIVTVQEFRIEEQGRKAYLGPLYFEIESKRLGQEVAAHDS